MLKKTITFEDFDGNDVTEDFYFNLSKSDIAEMEMSQKDGLTKYIKRIVAENDGAKLIVIFKELLIKSVGKRSEDGRRFIKNQEITDDFVQTNAYSELFVELATNADAAAAFIAGVVPESMKNAIEEASADELQPPAEIEPAWITEGRTPSQDELQNATPDQLRLAFQRKQDERGTQPLA